MSAATTLTLSPIAATTSNSQNTYYYYPQTAELSIDHDLHDINDVVFQHQLPYSTNTLTHYLPLEDRLLLERSAQLSAVLHKSHSYSGPPPRPKATILKQDSVNGRIATSLTDDNVCQYTCATDSTPAHTAHSFRSNDYVTAAFQEADADDEQADESENTLLVSSSQHSSGSGSRRNGRNYGRSRAVCCLRVNALINRTWCLSYLLPLAVVLSLVIVAWYTRDYAKQLLYWIETQNPWLIFATFMLLFVLVSFPVVVGYFVLMITSGYLFGFFKGLLTVILGANIGIAVAHAIIRSLRHHIPVHRIIKNETGRAILRVISGPKAFKVVLFTRLTPIPFGLQNAIFGISSIKPRVYHTASFLGLLPAQTINVYLGSTLRSMHEVLNNHGTAVTGYISFGVEVIFGVALMFWVIQKARKELSETLLSDISSEGKLLDIEV